MSIQQSPKKNIRLNRRANSDDFIRVDGSQRWTTEKFAYPFTFHAPVVSLTKFGAFVRILPGVDGLVHISEISNDRVEKVSDVLKVGDMVDVKLLDVDFDKKRISLSMKALLNDDAE